MNQRQEETKRIVIDSFRGDFGFLSNFYESSIWVDGERYGSVEHAYQAHKSDDPAVRKLIREAKSPSIAKKLGKSVQLPPDWEARKLALMTRFIRLKFENPLLRELLLMTEDAELVEGNTWNDTFWGVCRGKGHNHLGKLLMEERSRIRKEKTSGT